MFKRMIMEKLTKWLVGGDLFDGAKDVVYKLMDSDLSGEQKRNQAYKELKELATDTAGVFINIAIEVAVYVIKEKYGSGNAK